jgi:hypothetical protein
MAGYWNPVDLMQVRDAALTDNVPRMSRFDAQPLTGRLPYSMGHAAFEFIEERWGKESSRPRTRGASHSEMASHEVSIVSGE